MRPGSGGFTVLDRHPEAVLGPLAALFAFLGYLEISTVAKAHASVGAGWLPSVLAGVGCGVALLVVGGVRYRAGDGWVVLVLFAFVFAGLVGTRKQVWAVPNPPGLVTSPVQDGQLALCGVASFGVVVWLGWVYRATANNRRMAKQTARMPI
jgi:hypothetical protein